MASRETEGLVLFPGVQDDGEAVADDALAARPAVGYRLAVEQHADGAKSVISPVTIIELMSIGAEPGDVLASRRVLTLEEMLAPQHRLRRSQLDQSPGELKEVYVDWSGVGFVESHGNLSDRGLADLVEHRRGSKREGWRGEACSRLRDILHTLADIVDRGVLLTFDYGYSSGDARDADAETLVAYHRHQWNDDIYRRVGEPGPVTRQTALQRETAPTLLPALR